MSNTRRAAAHAVEATVVLAAIVLAAAIVGGCATTVSPTPSSSPASPTIAPTSTPVATISVTSDSTGSPGPSASLSPGGFLRDPAAARSLLEGRSFTFDDTPEPDGSPQLVGLDAAGQIRVVLAGDPLTAGSVDAATSVLVDAALAGLFGEAIGVVAASLGAGNDLIQWIVDRVGGAAAGPLDEERAFGDLTVRVVATSGGRLTVTISASPG